LSKYIAYFDILASTGIPILLYLDKQLKMEGEEICRNYSNVTILDYVTLDTSYVGENVQLPFQRNTVKDTKDYMCIQLNKLKHLKDAVPHAKTDFIAWIDFGIFHMIKNREKVMEALKEIATSDFPRDEILSPHCPGYYRHEYLFDMIIWRYCGSLLIVPKHLASKAYDAQMDLVMKHLPKLTWEVNYWHMMDMFKEYLADHDDSIIVNALKCKC